MVFHQDSSSLTQNLPQLRMFLPSALDPVNALVLPIRQEQCQQFLALLQSQSHHFLANNSIEPSSTSIDQPVASHVTKPALNLDPTTLIPHFYVYHTLFFLPSTP